MSSTLWPTPRSPEQGRPSHRSGSTSSLWVGSILWMVAIAAVVVVPVVLPELMAPSVTTGDPRVLLTVAIVAAAATVGEGALVAHHWLLWGVPLVAGVGTACLAVGYETVNVVTARDGDGSDIAAVPVLFAGVPLVFVALLMLSCAGYGLGAVVRRARSN